MTPPAACRTTSLVVFLMPGLALAESAISRRAARRTVSSPRSSSVRSPHDGWPDRRSADAPLPTAAGSEVNGHRNTSPDLIRQAVGRTARPRYSRSSPRKSRADWWLIIAVVGVSMPRPVEIDVSGISRRRNPAHVDLVPRRPAAGARSAAMPRPAASTRGAIGDPTGAGQETATATRPAMITGSVRRAARSGRIRTELVITASECDDHRDTAWVDAAALPRPVPSDLDRPDRPTAADHAPQPHPTTTTSSFRAAKSRYGEPPPPGARRRSSGRVARADAARAANSARACGRDRDTKK